MGIRNEMVFSHHKIIGEIWHTYQTELLNYVSNESQKLINDDKEWNEWYYEYYNKHSIKHEQLTDDYDSMMWKFWIFDLTKFIYTPENVDVEIFKKAVSKVCAKT